MVAQEVAGALAGPDLSRLCEGVDLGEHHVVAAGDLPEGALPRMWQGRTVTGLHVKRHRCPPARRAALAAASAAVAEEPSLRAVPSRVVGEYAVSLHLGQAVDLGRVLERAQGVTVARVHQACLASLAAFAGHDDELRAFVRARTAAPIPAFPVADRYRRARALAAELLGGIDLPPEMPGPLPQRRTLFCDPKPANFLDDHSGSGLEGDFEPVRIDLDLMHWECALSLQVVLVLFAHPVRAAGATVPAARFDVLRAQAWEAGDGLGIGRRELDAMILYHLLRNFASAAVGGDRVKARALAPMLRRAVETTATSGRRTRCLLDDWMTVQDDRARTPHHDETEAGPWR